MTSATKLWRFLPNGFIEVAITKEMQRTAKKRNATFYRKYGSSGTHRKDKNRQRTTGYIAEEAVKAVFQKLSYCKDNDAVDFILDGMTFDVKAQGCNAPPEPSFVGTLYEEQAMRDIDFYIFCRVQNDFTKAWIAGLMPQSIYLTEARLMEAGTQNSNFTYDQARYEMPYEEMASPKEVFLQSILGA